MQVFDVINVETKTSFHLLSYIQQFSERLQELIFQHFPPKEAGLIIALSLGEKNRLDEQIKLDYARVGAMHVLAVSGMHVGIVAFGLNYFLMLLLGKHPKRKGLISILSILGIWFFALLSGAASSVVRAALMFSLFLVGKQMLRSTNIWNIIAAAAFLMLVINTRSLFMVGFQLSFSALIAIIFFMPYLSRLCPFKNRLITYCWQLIALGIAAQLGTAPLSIFYFHQFPLLFWLSGLIIVPLASAGLLLSFIYVCLHSIPWLGLLLNKILLYLIQFMNFSMHKLSSISGAVIENLYLSLPVVLLLYCLLLFIMLWLHIKSRFFFLLASCTFVILIFIQLHIKEQQFQQQYFICYKSQAGGIVELIAGTRSIVFLTPEMKASRLDYLQKDIHLKKGINVSEYINLSSGNLLLQSGKNNILVLDSQYNTIDLKKLGQVDYVLLQEGVEEDLINQLALLSPQLVILSKNIPAYQARKYIQFLQEKGINFHNLFDQPGILINIKS